VDELLERALEKTGTLDALEAERTIEARGRIENLQELVGVAREYRQQTADASLAGFLQDISLVSDQDTIRDDRGLVTLMTLHNAKGLEFRAVFAIGMEEGIFPHVRAIEEQGVEEERRLCYVGMTRAMERLTLTHTMSRSLFGRRSYNLASVSSTSSRRVERANAAVLVSGWGPCAAAIIRARTRAHGRAVLYGSLSRARHRHRAG
jgi:DNA helicase-2/ATP-dependent DNA helicase PcrA